MIAKKNIRKLKTNPKIKVFLILLLLAATYWFFTSLSEKYTYLTTFNVSYTNIPENLLFQSEPTRQIDALIEATGFEIFSHKLKTKSLSFDLSEFEPNGGYTYYFLLNKEKPKIQEQIKNTKLLHFSKDSLLIFLGNLKTKKVPIVSNIHLSFKPGFKLKEKLVMIPDSIMIKGPEKHINTIQSVSTISKELIDIHENFEMKIPLSISDNQIEQITFSNQNVSIIGYVAKFTEGTIDVEISLPQTPVGKKIELFPKTAMVKYEVAFADYQKINDTSFKLTCQYPKEKNVGKKTLELVLFSKPDFIKEYTIHPQEVNYLIQNLEEKEK